MCLSFIGQIIYASVMLTSFTLTLAAIFSPGWRQFTVSDEIRQQYNIPTYSGLLPFFCAFQANDNAIINITIAQIDDYCGKWWNEMEDHEKAVIVAMCVALVAEVIALVWVGITICACFCKKFIIHPLPVLALCIALFLCIAIGLFGSNFKDDIDVNPANDNVLKDVLESSKLGYSFYLTCGALAGAIIDIVVGSLTVMFSNLCL